MRARPIARLLYAVTALCAGGGVVLAIALETAGVDSTPARDPGLYSFADENALGRFADMVSYFTEWSNVVVAIVFALLAVRTDGRGRLMHVLLLDALLMIIVTGIIYNAVLAPSAPPLHGWPLVSNTLVHVLSPILAVVTWAAFGPRGWLHRSLIPAALVIPIIWLVYTLIRGAIVHAYPYGFINVVEVGYAMAFVNILVIVALGIGICFVLIGIDRLARRWSG